MGLGESFACCNSPACASQIRGNGVHLSIDMIGVDVYQFLLFLICDCNFMKSDSLPIILEVFSFLFLRLLICL